MERLTKKINGVIHYIGENAVYPDGDMPCEMKPSAVRKAVEKLFDFEDKFESGKIIELPFKAGDALYKVTSKVIRCNECEHYKKRIQGVPSCKYSADLCPTSLHKVTKIYPSNVLDYVYLTKDGGVKLKYGYYATYEEAEARVKELSGGGDANS